MWVNISPCVWMWKSPTGLQAGNLSGDLFLRFFLLTGGTFLDHHAVLIDTIVAILRFEGNVKIPLASFAKFFPLHRVTDKELKDIFGAEITQTHLWGWHLDVVETFEPGFPLKVKMGPVVWRYFTLEDIEDSDSQQD